MPRIGPPINREYPTTFEEPKPEPVKLDWEKEWEDRRKIFLYLDVEPWKCPTCGGMNFGRMLYCIGCKVRHRGIIPRPENHKLHPRITSMVGHHWP